MKNLTRNMKLQSSVMIISLLILGINSANAAIGLEDCLQWARENYPEVKRYDIIDATAQCNLENAKHNWLPMISLGIQTGWLNNTPDLVDIARNTTNPSLTERLLDIMKQAKLKPISQWQYGVSMNVVQPIYDGGVAKVQKNLAKSKADVERAELDISMKKLEETVQDVYFALLILEKRNEQMSLQEAVLERNIGTLRTLCKEGSACNTDVKALEVAQLKLQQQSAVLRQNMEAYRMTLSLLTGHDISEEELTIPRKHEESPALFSSTPEMKFIESQLALLSVQKDYNRVSLLPKLGFYGQFNYGHPGKNIFDDLVNRNAKFNASLGIKLSWDINSFYNRRNNNKLIRLQKAHLDSQRELLVFRHNISNAPVLQQIRHMEEICSQDTKIIAICGDLRKAEEVKAENGAGDTNSLIDKINDEADAKLAGIIHEIEHIQSLYKLNHNGQ